jgi:hypothetical protein
MENKEGNTGVEKDSGYSMLDEIEMTISISENGHLSRNLLLLFNGKIMDQKARCIGLMEDNAELRQSLSELQAENARYRLANNMLCDDDKEVTLANHNNQLQASHSELIPIAEWFNERFPALHYYKYKSAIERAKLLRDGKE